jgi:hypothetical protein
MDTKLRDFLIQPLFNLILAWIKNRVLVSGLFFNEFVSIEDF